MSITLSVNRQMTDNVRNVNVLVTNAQMPACCCVQKV